ncbi:MAG: hypothetical protein H6736_24955 [Alphaproteobacteria bacterium]|nr:hypothetical protein [Alphaproteobacteria bacterium]
MRVVLCDSCGAPLDAPWDDLVVVCRYCGAHNLPGRPGDAVRPIVPADGRPRVSLGGRTYVVESRLGQGESSLVYRARWVVRLGELVVLKVLQARADADLFRNGWRVVRELQSSSVEGAEHFLTRLSSPVAHGLIDTDAPRPASVFGWKSGFVHTLREVGEVYRGGVPGEVVVWILKRLLELLGFVHRSGFVHGAVTPDHVLVHPYDHGAMLVGWSLARPWRDGRSERLLARSRTWSSLYGGATEATPALDVAMACRCASTIAGWHLENAVVQPALQGLLDRGAEGRVDDAWALRDLLVEISRATFGPAAYHPLTMPGWRR